MVVKRGEIWWASLEEPRGSEPGYHRPVVVVSANSFNRSLINTVIVTTITSNLSLASAPANFKLKKNKSNLGRDSVINLSQILTLDKSFLTEKIGTLDSKQLQTLNEGLKLVLNI